MGPEDIMELESEIRERDRSSVSFVVPSETRSLLQFYPHSYHARFYGTDGIDGKPREGAAKGEGTWDL